MNNGLIRGLAVTAILLIAGLAVALPLAGFGLVATLGVVGSVASLVGLPIVLLQLRAVGAISRATRDAVLATQQRLAHTITAGDVARTIKMAEQVQWYATQRQFELARLRLGDVRAMLIQFGESHSLVPADDRARFQELLLVLGVELQSLSGLAGPAKKVFAPQGLVAALDELSGILTRIEHQLRFPKES